MGQSDLPMPLLREPGKKLNLHVDWKGNTYVVECVLQQREIAIVLAVRGSDGTRRIIKIFPERKEICLYKRAFQCETRAYRRLRSCPVTPHYYGSSLSTSLIYSPDCTIPITRRLCGKQKAIMVQYLEGELVTPENFTVHIGQQALEGLKLLHALFICHKDICDRGRVRNAMLLRNGEVKWFDFERSRMDSDLRDGMIDFEWGLAVSILGPGGHMCRLRDLPKMEESQGDND